ncbi:MAG: 16S rRNA (cytidine(1402)-2'-O)-methyltransferase [Candidatus Wildermuthbacteria bacterium]|nr:16S rRNA (cytidine(1402)-2'-O)-methyltransferase [Candidatus Wildermuthbacteria bacterium]
MSTLFVVATPIGNLKDITYRALETLKGVDFILCEDTRVTKKLLLHYGISVPLISYHQHSSLQVMDRIFSLLSEGKNLAQVSDAGTPGISDPGNELVEYLSKKGRGIKIVPMPGPSAMAAAASIAGFPMDKFLFLGYPPHKRKRKSFFREAAASEHPVILYESPYRILKTLQELRELNREASVAVCRELTKMFETVYRGRIEEVLEQVKKDKQKGEFVIVVYKEKR